MIPYVIYYNIEGELVAIHAVLHTRRDISFIEGRILK